MERRSELVEVLDRARAEGARAAEALRVERVVQEQTGARQRLSSSSSLRWTVRVWREGGAAGLGEAPTREAALGAALRAAAAAGPDPHAGPCDKMPISQASIGIHDRRHDSISDEDRAEVLHHAERVLAQGGVVLHDFRYRQELETRSWASTRGVEATELGTTYSLGAEGSLGGQRAPQRIASRHFSDVASLPFGQELRRRLEGLNKRAPRPDSQRPMVLEPRVSAELVRAIAPLFAAEAVEAGNVLRGLLGRRLTTVLHLTDDGGLPSGLHSHLFDDRGVPPIAVPILKEGAVGSLFHGVEGARAHGLRPTGHFRDGRIRPSNLVVRPGARTRNVILTELGSWIQPDRLPPLDPATGRFTGEVPFLRVEAGERMGSFLAPLDVDLATLLGAVREVAADQERSGEIDAPTMVIEGVGLA